MNLINTIVIHKSYGKGTIVKQNEDFITVKFEHCEKNFLYPSAFDKFLIAENPEIQANILEKIFSVTNEFKPRIPSQPTKLQLETSTNSISKVHSKTTCHPFNFKGGDILSKMGATWFVSYAYYLYIDKSHINWKKYSNRIVIFISSKSYHQFWLTQVLHMNNRKLNTNKMGLDAILTKQMATKLLNSKKLIS